MDTIRFARINGKPIIGRVEYEEAVLKVNELVRWANEKDKREAEFVSPDTSGICGDVKEE